MPKLLRRSCWFCSHFPAPAQRPPRDKPQGVKTPGVQIPIAQLKPEPSTTSPARRTGSPSTTTCGCRTQPKDTVSRLDPKNNTVVATVDDRQAPVLGTRGRVWQRLGAQLRRSDAGARRSEDQRGHRDDPDDHRQQRGSASRPVRRASGWSSTNAARSCASIPATNKPVAEIHVPPGSYGVAFGEGAVWVTSTDGNSLSPRRPATNLVVETIAVGKAPRFLAVGEGAVWTLNQGDGSISRVDPKTNKVVATIEAGISGEGGEIAAGEGSVWATVFGFRSRGSTRQRIKSCSSSSARAATPSASDAGSSGCRIFGRGMCGGSIRVGSKRPSRSSFHRAGLKACAT